MGSGGRFDKLSDRQAQRPTSSATDGDGRFDGLRERQGQRPVGGGRFDELSDGRGSATDGKPMSGDVSTSASCRRRTLI